MAKSLDRVVKKSKNLNLLKSMSTGMGLPVKILNKSGRTLYGDESLDSTKRFSILLNEIEEGWVEGESSAEQIAHVLEILLEERLEKDLLGKETLESYKELNLFYYAPEKFRSCQTFDEVAEVALKETANQLAATQASIMKFNQKDQTLHVCYIRGQKSTAGARTFKPGEGIAGRVFLTGEPELINTVDNEKQMIDSNHGIRSLICAPVCIENEVVSILNVSSKESRRFTAKDLKMASALAIQAGAAAENLLLQERRIEQDRVKQYLQRYVAPQVMQSIVTKSEEDILRTISRPITSLFCDIRNFTKLCTTMPAESIVENLNTFLTKMTEVIFSSGGTLDKFVGDMIVAFFNAPEETENHELKAVQTAIAMQKAILEFEDPWIRDHFKTGIGISTGNAVVGNIGSSTHSDYTAIGESVNLAARLQAIAAEGEIFVSESIYNKTFDSISYGIRKDVNFKGLDHPAATFLVKY